MDAPGGIERGWTVTDIEAALKALGAERRRLGEQILSEIRLQDKAIVQTMPEASSRIAHTAMKGARRR